MFPARFLRLWRAIRWLSLLLAALVIGWASLAHAPGSIPLSATGAGGPPFSLRAGGEKGAGGPLLVTTLPAGCGPLDFACYIDTLASSAAQSVMSALTPVIDDFLKNPVNIVNQTPPIDSYQNATVIALNRIFVGAVDAALACLLVIGGYTIIVGSHLRMPQASLSELLPRVVMVVGAVHFNLLFLGFFIDLENTLCLAVIHATDTEVLTNTIAKMLTFNPDVGLLLVILAITLGILGLLLFVQMIARLALVDLLLVLGPLGLGCLMLPQTVRWGRLWLTSFSAAVWVQFIQVTALALGSVFLSAITAPGTVFHGNPLATAFLAIGTLGLVLKIPGMLHHWALSPLWQGRHTQESSGGGEADGISGGESGYAAGGSGGEWGGNIVEGTIVTEESAGAAGAAGESTILLLA